MDAIWTQEGNQVLGRCAVANPGRDTHDVGIVATCDFARPFIIAGSFDSQIVLGTLRSVTDAAAARRPRKPPKDPKPDEIAPLEPAAHRLAQGGAYRTKSGPDRQQTGPSANRPDSHGGPGLVFPGMPFLGCCRSLGPLFKVTTRG